MAPTPAAESDAAAIAAAARRCLRPRSTRCAARNDSRHIMGRCPRVKLTRSPCPYGRSSPQSSHVIHIPSALGSISFPQVHRRRPKSTAKCFVGCPAPHFFGIQLFVPRGSPHTTISTSGKSSRITFRRFSTALPVRVSALLITMTTPLIPRSLRTCSTSPACHRSPTKYHTTCTCPAGSGSSRLAAMNLAICSICAAVSSRSIPFESITRTGAPANGPYSENSCAPGLPPARTLAPTKFSPDGCLSKVEFCPSSPGAGRKPKTTLTRRIFQRPLRRRGGCAGRFSGALR
mmetsp:Transcript_7664/g.20039  ORF Transcript_7664/g.20039 Transcript_7664/m.20039 type:complete len:290 (-) Transcript_7664:143-1012(-)